MLLLLLTDGTARLEGSPSYNTSLSRCYLLYNLNFVVGRRKEWCVFKKPRPVIRISLKNRYCGDIGGSRGGEDTGNSKRVVLYYPTLGSLRSRSYNARRLWSRIRANWGGVIDPLVGGGLGSPHLSDHIRIVPVGKIVEVVQGV